MFQAFEKSLKSNVGSELNMKMFTTGYTTDTISSCAFGLESNAIDNPDHDLRKLGTYFGKPKLIDKLIMIGSRAFPWLNSFGR